MKITIYAPEGAGPGPLGRCLTLALRVRESAHPHLGERWYGWVANGHRTRTLAVVIYLHRVVERD